MLTRNYTLYDLWCKGLESGVVRGIIEEDDPKPMENTTSLARTRHISGKHLHINLIRCFLRVICLSSNIALNFDYALLYTHFSVTVLQL